MYAYYGEYEYGYSKCNFTTIEECIKDAKECGYEDYIYIGEQEVEIYGNCCVDYIIEDIENNCNVTLDISDEQFNDLEARLNAEIDKWIKDNDFESNYFKIVNARRYNL